MTKKLNDIIGEARSSLRTVDDVNEEIESYLRFIGTLSEEEFEEEYNQLDELSKKTLIAYSNKAANVDLVKDWAAGKNRKKTRNRLVGIGLAVDKRFSRARVNATEEVENIDELSRKTIGNYINKATTSGIRRIITGSKYESMPTPKDYKRLKSIELAQNKTKKDSLTPAKVNASEEKDRL